MKIAEEIVEFGNAQFVLTNQRALFWEEKSLLVLSDFHAGKAAHFRKNGIALPTQIHQKDTKRLEKLIQHFAVREVIVVGDLIHAGNNREVEEFSDWIRTQNAVNFHLIKGNHDRISDAQWFTMGLKTVRKEMEIDEIHFSHEPIENGKRVISGHIHPGISLKMPTKRHLKFPCFVVSENQIILPAFSEFTGQDTQNLPQNASYYVLHDSGISKFDF